MDSINQVTLTKMMTALADAIKGCHEELSKLDGAIGDGDHGTTMLRAVQAAEKAATESADDAGMKATLHAIGWGVMCVDGGSTGPLVGSLFMGMSDGVGDAAELDGPGVAAMFEAGLAKLQKQSKAQVGDKTMIDALVPAVEALRAGADKGESVSVMMAAAADAAAQGAESTKAFKAKFGRARNLGDRVIGHADPGATSIARLFRAFADAVQA